MKTVLAAAILLVAAASGFAGDDEAAIRATINHYFDGHATGDGAHFKLAFHPVSKLFWIKEGTFAERTSDDYIAGASGKPAPDESDRKRTIEMIDISGNAAVAKLKLDYPKAVIVDYMSLLKVDREWKIVNKIYYVQPK
ncbi:MAG TPA: nuclear transport factor 2 family protein [Thermoanaerobaculia bacterium]